MNLGQAIAGSSHHLAIRQVGDRRVIVDRGQEFLTVLIQRRSKSRWIADDNGAYTHQINTYRVGIERNDGAVKRVGDVRSETGLSRLSMWNASSCSSVRTPHGIGKAQDCTWGRAGREHLEGIQDESALPEARSSESPGRFGRAVERPRLART